MVFNWLRLYPLFFFSGVQGRCGNFPSQISLDSDDSSPKISLELLRFSLDLSVATNFDTKNTAFAAKLDIDDSMAWPSGRLRHVILYCLCIYKFASTTKTLKCIFYICTHKDIFLIITHVCNYIYIYTTISIHISIDGYIIYIYVYMYLYSLDIQRPEKEFSLGFVQTKIWSGGTVHLKEVKSPGCLGIWSLHPQKSTYCWWFRNPANSPVDMVDIPVYIFAGFHRRQVVHDPTQQTINDIRWLM